MSDELTALLESLASELRGSADDRLALKADDLEACAKRVHAREAEVLEELERALDKASDEIDRAPGVTVEDGMLDALHDLREQLRREVRS